LSLNWLVIPAQAGPAFQQPNGLSSSCLAVTPKPQEELEYTQLLPHDLRAIRYANVRSGILPPQSCLRRNGDK
jgi:hypothetical protein